MQEMTHHPQYEQGAEEPQKHDHSCSTQAENLIHDTVEYGREEGASC